MVNQSDVSSRRYACRLGITSTRAALFNYNTNWGYWEDFFEYLDK